MAADTKADDDQVDLSVIPAVAGPHVSTADRQNALDTLQRAVLQAGFAEVGRGWVKSLIKVHLSDLPYLAPQADRNIVTAAFATLAGSAQADEAGTLFAGALEALGKSVSDPRQQLHLLRFSCAFLTAYKWSNVAAGTVPAWFNRFAIAQFTLIGALQSSSKTIFQSAQRLWRACMVSVMPLCRMYLDVVVNSPKIKAHAAVGFLLAHVHSGKSGVASDQFRSAYRDRLAQAFVASLADNTNNPDHVVQSYLPLVKQLVHADLPSIMPAVEPLLKTPTEASVAACTLLFSNIPADLSEHLPRLFQPLLISVSKSPSNDIRQAVPALVAAIIRQCSASESMVSWIQALCDTMLGKQGPIPLWQHRFGILNCLEGSARGWVASGISAEPAARIVAPACIELAGKEGHKETKQQCLRVLGVWMATARQWTDALADTLKKGLTSAVKGVALVHLEALVEAQQSSFVATQSAVLAPQLEAIVASAVAKPKENQVEGILALLALAKIASHSSAYAAQFSRLASPIAGSSDPAHFVFGKALFIAAAKTEEDEASIAAAGALAHLAALFGLLQTVLGAACGAAITGSAAIQDDLTGASSRTVLPGSTQDGAAGAVRSSEFHRAWVRLLVCSVRPARETATRALDDSVKTVPQLVQLMLHAFEDCLWEMCGGLLPPVASGGAAGAFDAASVMSGASRPSTAAAAGAKAGAKAGAAGAKAAAPTGAKAGAKAGAKSVASPAAGVEESKDTTFNPINTDSTTIPATPNSTVLANALLHCVAPGSLEAVQNFLPKLLLLAHHPFVAADLKRGRSLWRALSCRVSGVKNALQAADGLAQVDAALVQPAAARTLQALLFGTSGWKAPLTQFRSAASAALCTMLQDTSRNNTHHSLRSLAAGAVLNALVQQIQELGRADASVTAVQYAIWKTPEGVVCEARDPNDRRPAKASSQPRRGEEAWIEETRREIDAKRGKVTVDPEILAKLAEQSAVRATIEKRRSRLAVALSALTVVARACADQIAPLVPFLLPTVIPVLNSRTVPRESFDCAFALISATDTPMHRVASNIVRLLKLSCVQQVVLHQQSGASAELLASLPVLQKVTAFARDILVRHQETLHQSAVYALLLVFRSVLSCKPSVAGSDHILQIVLASVTLTDAAVAHLDNTLVDGLATGADVQTRAHVTAQRAVVYDDSEHVYWQAQAAVLRAGRAGVVSALLNAAHTALNMTPAPVSILQELVKDCVSQAEHVLGSAPEHASAILTEDEWSVFVSDIGLRSGMLRVRLAVLSALETVLNACVPQGAVRRGSFFTSAVTFALFLAKFDPENEVAGTAVRLLERSTGDIGGEYTREYIPRLGHSESCVRTAAAKAIAAAMALMPSSAVATATALCDNFVANKPVVVENEVKMSKETVDFGWTAREATAFCVGQCGEAKTFSAASIESLTRFIVAHGLADENDSVRSKMLSAGATLVDKYGAECLPSIMPILEAFLDGGSAAAGLAAATQRQRDHQQEGVIVLLGSASRHLAMDDPKVARTVSKLIDALSTPVQAVQSAVAQCLPALVPSFREQAPAVVQQLMDKLLRGESYGVRRGAAYGLAGIVKGLGLGSLKQLEIMEKLEAAAEGKETDAKQGALFAFECLCSTLGRLFEPYVIRLLPMLLNAFGDRATQVREAAQDAARVVMANLTGHGVKLVMPAILAGLGDTPWRTKQASIVMLGSMAYCAPRQLSQCLPQIVPQLTVALGDTHPKVQVAGREALNDIGSVIRNAEISSIVPIILAALAEPTDKTEAALDALNETSFINSIDPPSLALIVPILKRGLEDRVTSAKLKAANIVGGVIELVADPKDLLVYLEMLVPPLKTAIIDPIPEVRSAASRGLGALIKGLGEESFADVIAWLTSTLRSNTSSVERSGGAQGLAEVMVALGEPRFSAILHELLPLIYHAESCVREGLLWTICFLPGPMGEDFAPYISRLLPTIVMGLADGIDMVREVAMKAGQRIVTQHALTHSEVVLPVLEAGMFDDNWRIRQSSVSLLGDLLFQVSGAKAVGMTGDDNDDAGMGTAVISKAIVRVLGQQRRNYVFAAMYVMRSDLSAVVRQTALQVWKTVVANTPRTLRELLGDLIGLITNHLASSNADRRQVAGRCLGEVIRKLGDRVLPEVVPMLREGLRNESSDMRHGACLGLSELVQACNRAQLEEFMHILLPAVQDAVSAQEPQVQEAAAQAFTTMHRVAGRRVLEDILPALLTSVSSRDAEEAARAVHGLQNILTLRSHEVLPYLVPKLCSRPITAFHARALSAIAAVAGKPLYSYTPRLLHACIGDLAGEAPDSVEDLSTQDASGATLLVEGKVPDLDRFFENPIADAARSFLVHAPEGAAQILLSKVLEYVNSPSAARRAVACMLTGAFMAGTPLPLNEFMDPVLYALTKRLHDPDQAAMLCGVRGLAVVLDENKSDDLLDHLEFLRTCIGGVISDCRHRRGGVGTDAAVILRAFTTAEGVAPFIGVLVKLLINTATSVAEQSVKILGDIMNVSAPAALSKSHLTKIIGGLLRIMRGQAPPGVKVAIVTTAGVALDKAGSELRMFLPQLQTTLVKMLADPAEVVRQRSADVLGKLMVHSQKVDTLVKELCNNLSGDAEEGVQAALISALRAVFEYSGAAVPDAMRDTAIQVTEPFLGAGDEDLRKAAAACLGRITAVMNEQELQRMMDDHLAASSISETGAPVAWPIRQAHALFLLATAKANAAFVRRNLPALVPALQGHMTDDKVPVREVACACVAVVMSSKAAAGEDSKESEPALARLLTTLGRLITDSTPEVRRAACTAVKDFAKANPSVVASTLQAVVPPLMKVVSDSNVSVKLAAERALVHALQIHSNPATLTTFLASTDNDTSGALTMYAKRVLKKLPADSDDEADS